MKKRKNPERAAFLIVLFAILFSTSFLFSVIYKITEHGFVSSYLEDLGNSAAGMSSRLSAAFGERSLALRELAGQDAVFLNDGEYAAFLHSVSGKIDSFRIAELHDREGTLLAREFSSMVDEKLLEGYADLSSISNGLSDIFGFNQRVYMSLRQEIGDAGGGLDLRVLSEIDGETLRSPLKIPPNLAIFVKGGEFSSLFGKSAVEGCVSCHLGKQYQNSFPVPHKGFIKGRGFFLSGNVDGHRFAIYPLPAEYVRDAFLVLRFDSEDMVTPLVNFRSVLLPSWVLLCIVLTAGTVFLYWRFREEVEMVAVPGERVEGEMPLDADRGSKEVFSGIFGAGKDHRGTERAGIPGVDDEMTKAVDPNGDGADEAVSKIRDIHEFLISVNRITYPERVGETIVWNLISLIPTDLVILAIGDEPGAGGEYDVFSAQKFRKDSVSDIFLQKIKKEFPEYARGVLTRKIIDVEEDAFFARYSYYGHRLKSLLLLPIEIRGVKLGAIALFRKSHESFLSREVEFASVLSAHLGTVIENSKLHVEVKSNYFNTIRGLVSAIEEKNRYRRGHSERVKDIALSIGRKAGLSKRRMSILFQTAILHDIGKIGVDSDLLNKKGELSANEMSIIKQHPVIGYRIIEPLNFLREVKACISEHHERYDGTGYPYGLNVDDLTLEGRILAVADAFDAMTSDRPHRSAMSGEGAVEELRNNAGTQFDPYVVELFMEVYREQGEGRKYGTSGRDTS